MVVCSILGVNGEHSKYCSDRQQEWMCTIKDQLQNQFKILFLGLEIFFCKTKPYSNNLFLYVISS